MPDLPVYVWVIGLAALYLWLKKSGWRLPILGVGTPVPNLDDPNDTDTPLIALLKKLAATEYGTQPLVRRAIMAELEALDGLIKEWQTTPDDPPAGVKS